MITDNNIQILCGALADQTASEQEGHGIFTKALLNGLAANPDLMALPIDLVRWNAALPAALLMAHGIEVPTSRDALDPADTPTAPRDDIPQMHKAS
jgi:hypothetical protein